MSPALAYYQELDAGLALHGFISHSLIARPRWGDSLERNVRYGLAFAAPVPGVLIDAAQSLHMFVEAQGRTREGEYMPPREGGNYEFLPGLHWQMGENWWMSGALILPVGAGRIDPDFWQLTCSWRF